MKDPIISDLKCINQRTINALEKWLRNIKSGKRKAGKTCPFNVVSRTNRCEYCNYEIYCSSLFDNLGGESCPCHVYGEEATILAFEIICDMGCST